MVATQHPAEFVENLHDVIEPMSWDTELRFFARNE